VAARHSRGLSEAALSLRLAGVAGEGGAGAVVGEHVVEDVDEGGLVLRRPGRMGLANESMSARAAAYQEQITGEDVGLAYRIGNVKFDGYSNGVLQDAKGEGYAWAVKNGEFIPNYEAAQGIVEAAERQVAAANGTPITWSVAEEPVVGAIDNLFADNGIAGINVVYVPPAG
jgi:hypothetical protein